MVQPFGCPSNGSSQLIEHRFEIATFLCNKLILQRKDSINEALLVWSCDLHAVFAQVLSNVFNFRFHHGYLMLARLLSALQESFALIRR
jgi:hypothetical protein